MRSNRQVCQLHSKCPNFVNVVLLSLFLLNIVSITSVRAECTIQGEVLEQYEDNNNGRYIKLKITEYSCYDPHYKKGDIIVIAHHSNNAIGKCVEAKGSFDPANYAGIWIDFFAGSDVKTIACPSKPDDDQEPKECIPGLVGSPRCTGNVVMQQYQDANCNRYWQTIDDCNRYIPSKCCSNGACQKCGEQETYRCVNNVVQKLVINNGVGEWQVFDDCNRYNPPRKCIGGVCIKIDDSNPDQECDQAECQSQNGPIGIPYLKDGKTYRRYYECKCVENECPCEHLEKECKGKISIEIIDGINHNILKDEYIYLEVPELEFGINSLNGIFYIDGTCPLTQYTINCSANGYMSSLDGYNDGRGTTHITTDKDGNWHGTISLMPYIEGRKIKFSGFEWDVRDSGDVLEGPGCSKIDPISKTCTVPLENNYWSDSIKNVWVDELGRLHLKVTKNDVTDKWYCSEVTTVDSLGYGDYTFFVEGHLRDKLIENEVLGLFNYFDDNHEIDIEYGNVAWSKTNDFFGQFATQPTGICKFISFSLDNIIDEKDETVSTFYWQNDAVRFGSSYYNIIDSNGWRNEKCIPEDKDNLHTHINLWLYGPKTNINEDSSDIIINQFVYGFMS